jgi:hypothetical protein
MVISDLDSCLGEFEDRTERLESGCSDHVEGKREEV